MIGLLVLVRRAQETPKVAAAPPAPACIESIDDIFAKGKRAAESGHDWNMG